MKATGDHILLKSIREGDEAAFTLLFIRYYRRVYHFSSRLVISREIAEEVTSDVFFQIWSKRNRLRPELSIMGLLLKITRDKCINHLRKVSRKEDLKTRYLSQFPSIVGANAAEEKLILDEYKMLGEEAIRELPTRRRQIFEMYHREGLDQKTIATQLGISINTVKVQLHRASKQIKGFLTANTDLQWILLLLAGLS